MIKILEKIGNISDKTMKGFYIGTIYGACVALLGVIFSGVLI